MMAGRLTLEKDKRLSLLKSFSCAVGIASFLPKQKAKVARLR